MIIEYMGATATPIQLSPLQQAAQPVSEYSDTPESAAVGPADGPLVQHEPIQVVEGPAQAEPIPGAPSFQMTIPDEPLPPDFSIDTSEYYNAQQDYPLSMQEQRAIDSGITAPEDIQAHEYYSMMPTAEQVATAAEQGEITFQQPAAQVIERIVERPVPSEQAPGKAGYFALPVLLGVGVYSIFFA